MNFSIIIVSWNNLDYLRNTINSIKLNSYFNHEILVHINEGTDSTIEYLNRIEQKYTHSKENIGLCKGANLVAKLATNDYICLVDDDLYFPKDWDRYLVEFKEKNNIPEPFWLSSVMIEPRNCGKSMIRKDFGNHPKVFQYIEFSFYYNSLRKSIPNIINIQNTPLLLTRKSWKQIGGYKEEFSPGIGSEEGLAKDLYDIGCRNFVCCNESLVYHFQTKTTSKLTNYTSHAQNRETQFQKLYGISTSEFGNLINRGQEWRRQDNV